MPRRPFGGLHGRGQPESPEARAGRAALSLQKALRSGDAAALDEAVDLLRHVLVAVQGTDPNRVHYLSNLGVALRCRFDRTGNRADLDEAVSVGRQAVASVVAGHPGRADLLANLYGSLEARFEQLGGQADLDELVAVGRQAVAASPPGEPDQVLMLAKLGVALRIRSGRTGNDVDLDEAVTMEREAVAATPAGHPSRAGRLYNLSIALQDQYTRSGDLEALDAVVAARRDAVAAARSDHPDVAAMLSNLGNALQDRFRRTCRLADLDEAVAAGRRAAGAASPRDAARPARLSNLGVALRARFDVAGDPADLDEAVTTGREAAETAPPDAPDRAAILSNLSGTLATRFEQTGSQQDIDDAVAAAREAADAIPAGHPGHARCLSGLGAVLQARFDHFGRLADLTEAVAVDRAAVAAGPGQDGRAGMLSNLSVALRVLFERTGRPADLDDAVAAGDEAVAASPHGHPQRDMRLSNLGGALQVRFEQTGNPADLDKAIEARRAAVAATPPGRPGRARNLSNLGLSLQARFEHSGDRSDLDEAIATGRAAVAASPPDRQDRAAILLNLSLALQLSERAADLDEAMAAGREAMAVAGAAPYARAAAARALGRAAAERGRWREAVPAFATAIGLLGLVAPRSLARTDQEHFLHEMRGLAAEAAAACVLAGLPDRAVELFEQGRGVLLAQALDTRTDLTVLAERHPGLAEDFARLRDRLDRPGGPGELGENEARAGATSMREARLADQRRADAETFDRIIAEIQATPGFSGFLRPPPVSELAAAAAEGPIVLVNVSQFGSHALVLTGSGVRPPVPLARLTPEQVHRHVTGILGAFGGGAPPADRRAAEQQMTDTLGWLWDVLAGPVLDALGITGPPGPGEHWPRLWWCLSGLLSFLPVHAAGHHGTVSGAPPATVMDRVVSSYTPTVRVLAHGRRTSEQGRSRSAPPGSEPVLVVAMQETPGAPGLPGARAEAVDLRRRFPGRVTVLTGPGATSDAVLTALPAARWVHFACHALSDLANPSASRLLLADDEQGRLTMLDLARLRLPEAELAFLSACGTARPGGRLADEAIHLASAFQLAGFQQVIATLWPVADRRAAITAADIYARLAAGEDPAHAVHATARRLRDRQPAVPSRWAAHMHSGI